MRSLSLYLTFPPPLVLRSPITRSKQHIIRTPGDQYIHTLTLLTRFTSSIAAKNGHSPKRPGSSPDSRGPRPGTFNTTPAFQGISSGLFSLFHGGRSPEVVHRAHLFCRRLSGSLMISSMRDGCGSIERSTKRLFASKHKKTPILKQ